VNTAAARRLAFGDRVVWVGRDGYQPAGLGTIIRVTAHHLAVSWDAERVIRYRRVQLDSLRHAKPVDGTGAEQLQASDGSEGDKLVSLGPG
jgi:hypothetical protein